MYRTLGFPENTMPKKLSDGVVEFNWVDDRPTGFPIRDLGYELSGDQIIDYYGPIEPLADYFAFAGLRVCSEPFRALLIEFEVPDIKFYRVRLQYHKKRLTLESTIPYYILNAYSQIPILDYEQSCFRAAKRLGKDSITRIERMVLDEDVVSRRHFVQTGGGDPKMPTMIIVSDAFATSCSERGLVGVFFEEPNRFG